MAEESKLSNDLRPVPDPTALTTAALVEAKQNTKEAIANLREILETRLDGMDKAVQLISLWRDKTLGDVNDKFQSHYDLLHEKLRALGDRIDTTDRNIEKSESNRLVATEQAASMIRDALNKAETSQSEKFAASAIANDKIERATNVRIQGVEDFQKLITAERGMYVQQKDLDLWSKALESKIDPLATKNAVTAGQWAVMGILMTVGIALTAMVVAYVSHGPGK